MRKYFLLTGFYLTSLLLFSQTISKTTSSVISGTVCPVSATWYEVSVPSGLTSCEIVWSATNGQITRDAYDQRKAKVEWSDTPGASGTVTATFTNCSSGTGTTVSKTELILSVKNQAWGAYGTSINVDYCTKAQAYITVPRMYVQGTGGIGQPTQTEVAYSWTLPSGWREVGTNRTGSFGTGTNFITIEPIDCSKPGTVNVYGTLAGAGPFCTEAQNSAIANISLNGANPVATVGPQVGFTGVLVCNTTPVTFYATTSVALGCISGYNWQYPASWSFMSQSGNSITLQPTGTSADAAPIKATISFTCGSSITSGNYVPPYITPILSGSDLICTSSSYTIQNAGAVSVTWSSSNTNIATVNSSGLVTRITNANGEVNLSATLPCDVPPVTKTIWVGVPQYLGDDVLTAVPSVYCHPGSSSSGQVYMHGESAYLTVPGATAYSWTVFPNPPSTPYFSVSSHPGYLGGYIYVNSNAPTGSYFVIAQATNACGNGSGFSGSFEIGHVDQFGTCQSSGGGWELLSYPNPVSKEVYIITGLENQTGQEAEIVLISDKQGVVLKDRTTANIYNIDVTSLPDGIYFLRVIRQGKTLQKKVIVKKT